METNVFKILPGHHQDIARFGQKDIPTPAGRKPYIDIFDV